MSRSRPRVRLAITSSLAAAAVGIAVVAMSSAVSSAVSASAPPSTPEVPASVPADPDAVTDAIVAAAADENLPLDRDCVAGIVAQIPADDLPIVAAQMTEEAEVAATVTASNVTVPDLTSMSLAEGPELPDISVPTLSLPDDPELSPEAEALASGLIACLAGDADPVLVDKVVTVISEDPEAEEFDPACVRSVLSTFPDELLQAIIDSGGDLDASDASLPDDVIGQAFLLFACTELGSMTDGSVATTVAG